MFLARKYFRWLAYKAVAHGNLDLDSQRQIIKRYEWCKARCALKCLLDTTMLSHPEHNNSHLAEFKPENARTHAGKFLCGGKIAHTCACHALAPFAFYWVYCANCSWMCIWKRPSYWSYWTYFNEQALKASVHVRVWKYGTGGRHEWAPRRHMTVICKQ